MSLLILYAEFFKMGLFAVGGGLATLPFLFRMADQYEWLTRENVGNFLAIAQSSPGPIGVNLAAQTGFLYGGITVGIVAALGLVTPAIIIIAVIARMLQAFKENKIVASVFSGLRPAATGLLAAAGLGALQLALYNNNWDTWKEILRWKECILFAIIFLMIRKLKDHKLGHPIVFVIIGATAGILLKL
jgi:chromate transporter